MHVTRQTAIAQLHCGHKAFLAVELLLCMRRMKTSAKRKAIIATKSKDLPFLVSKPGAAGLRQK
jgi:hypothetical protein